MTELEIHQAAYLAVVKRVANERDEAVRLLKEARKQFGNYDMPYSVQTVADDIDAFLAAREKRD